MTTPLYRPEVLEARHNRWLGRILIRQPPMHWVLTWCVVVFALFVAVFVMRFEYSRTAHIEGRLADRVNGNAGAASSASLVAELVVSERLLGTVEVGRDVQLRYVAFPFQTYGRYRGRIVSVSRTPMPDRVDAPPDAHGDSRYIAIAQLERDVVRDDHGTVRPLRPGLQVQADVIVETHRLYEWMFKPFSEKAPDAKSGASHNTASR